MLKTNNYRCFLLLSGLIMYFIDVLYMNMLIKK